MSGNSDPLTEKDRLKKARDELKLKGGPDRLNAAQALSPIWPAEPKRALKQAKECLDLALVDVLWGAECVLWDGTKMVLFTSVKTIADECQTLFGWKVDKKDGPTYKYSESFYDKENKQERAWNRVWLEWIVPPSQWSVMFISGLNENKNIDRWHTCTVQRGLWWAMELRRPFAATNKDKPLDMKGLLLPRKYAGKLQTCKIWCPKFLPDDIDDWIQKGAGSGPEDSTFDDAHEGWDMSLLRR